MSHIYQFPYPCLGHWGFLNLSIGTSGAYQEVLERIKNGEQYLDLGCCVGQDIRKLVHDGAPSQNTYGSDLKASFWDIGYELFCDKSTLKTTFIEADIFDANSDLHKLDGKVDIVNAASFFHLFDWNDQVSAAKTVVQLMKPSSGSLLVGRQGGRVEPGEFTGQVGREKSLYWHNPESFARLWKQVGEETESEWEVDAYFDESVDMRRKARGGLAQYIPLDAKMMKFVVRRV
jgi:SAM-dependent methyltransferase